MNNDQPASTPSNLSENAESAAESDGAPMDFGQDANSPASRLSADWPTLQTLERRYIDRVLSRTAGNKTRAAEMLGIDRRTLNRLFARERAAASKTQT
jgi:DNA-binding NtrC family response regulator